MSGHGSGDGGLHRFEVPHFANEDDVGVLSHHVLERTGEAEGVGPDFALRDDALPVLVDEFNRVFDGHDVPAEVRVDMMQHRGHSRGFAAACGPGNQDQPPLFFRQVPDNRRDEKLVELQRAGGNAPRRHAQIPFLVEQIQAEAFRLTKRHADVHIPVLDQAVCQSRGQVLLEKPGEMFGSYECAIDFLNRTEHAHTRSFADRYKEVGRLLGFHPLQ